ncbi:hypothetical protein DPMN_186694 [Dreissena polymorpha]|nr:hypothetical protein DPMN_186694 [Dreissena polymorpha]
METSSRNVKPTRNRSSSLSEDDVKRSRLKQGKHSGRSQQHSLKTHASSSESSSDSESNVKARQASKYASSDDSDREKPMKKKSFGLVILNPENEHIKARSKVKVTRDYRSTSRSPDRRLKPAGRTDEKRSPPQQPKRKLTEEERQRRLAEMEENARWREDQRRGNVTRYREEDREEEAKQSRNYETTGSSEFVNPLMSKHAENSSVEDRIKRNRHNILRTTADMDRGFSKR